MEAGPADLPPTAAIFGECRIVELPVVHDVRGNLTFVEAERHLPFPVRRVFYLYDVPGGSQRAGHALRRCHQFIIAISGSFDVVLDDGQRRARFHMNRAHYGLHVTPLVWRELDNFSSNSVCLVLASEYFDPGDYYRDYGEFLEAAGSGERSG
ncbi:MAG: FdtA/QdtA family cupin domain-containing protein [Chloroflexota bacterium]